MAETVDSVEAPPEEEALEPQQDDGQHGAEADGSKPTDSLTDLFLQLGRDVAVLSFCETQLAASRHMPEVRRAARDVAAALLASLALLAAFVFVNVTVLLALSSAVSPWLAALILAVVWLAVGAALAVWLMVRAGQATGWKWWRVFTAGREGAHEELERARDEAAEAVRATLERLAPAITVEIATAAVPMAAGVASGVVDASGDILEASDDAIEAIAEDLPGGGVINQIWDVALTPGRFGLRIATTVLKRDEAKS